MFSFLILATAAGCVAGDSPAELRLIDAGAVSCDSLKPKVPDRPVAPREQARVKAYFDDVLFDQPTARWKFEKVKAGELVCGNLNSKNRMGAYAGWTPFIYNLKDGTGSVYDDEKKVWLFEMLCHDVDPRKSPY